jgi:PAS domain S-box-containing protein
MKASESLQNDQSAATENALRRAVDTTPAFIHTARPDGYLDYFNRGWLDFLGKSLEDVCGWRWTESVHPEDVAALVQKWHAALASGEPFEIEARVRRADGSYRVFLHRKLPLRDEHGNIVKWFGSSVDIEDRKRAEEQFRRSDQELQKSELSRLCGGKKYFLTCRDAAKAWPGSSHQKAYNINLALAQLGVIEVVRAGDPHLGGRASYYRYLLPQSRNGKTAIAA